jgi:transposase-like protein
LGLICGIFAQKWFSCREPSERWHLDEMMVRIAGERMYLWRAVDDEGEVLDMLVQHRRHARAATTCAPTPRRSGVCD